MRPFRHLPPHAALIVMTQDLLAHHMHGEAQNRLEASRTAPGLGLRMIESAGPAMTLTTPALSELVISQAVGSPFHFQCNFGAGAFSGHALPQDFVVVPPGVPTWCNIEDWHRTRYLGIPADWARKLLGRPEDDPLDFGLLHTRSNHDPLAANLLEHIWQEMAAEDRLADRFLASLVAVLLITLERLASRADSDARQLGGLPAHQSRRVIAYIRANLHHDLTLQDMANHTGLSPWHFARAFRQSLGVPPHRYLTRLRLARASELLEHTDQSITEVASATGYTSQQLSRQFRRHMGCCPTDYRRLSKH